jgi:S1-C subfamily serine protease
MDKLVVSSEEVASVAETLPADLATPRLPAPLPKTWRVLLAPLAFVLPALCFATIIIWLLTRRKEPRVRHAWMQYCCALLVISGIGSSIVAGFAFFMLTSPAPRPAVPFALDTQVELPGSLSTEPLTPRDLASRVEGAVFIVSRDSKWLKPTRETLSFSGFGTGVLLFAGENDFLLATSRHVLDGEAWQRSSPYTGDAVLWDRSGGFSRAQIVGRHKDFDLMLLRMPRVAGKAAFAQPVLDFEKIAPGERIMVFGHPEGLFFSLSDGLVSRKEPPGRIQITAPVSPGASGGPVYDLRGRLLGIVSGMVDKRLSPHSENLNFAVRADSLLHPEQWQFEPLGKTALEKFIAASATSAAPVTDSPSPNP